MSKLTLKQQRFADEYIIGEVYCIENLKNQKKYIGVTTRTISERFKEHCKAQSAIGKTIRKYGEENFSVIRLDYARSKEELLRLETEYIEKFGTYKNGYNQTIGGDGVIGDLSLDVVLNERQKRFVRYVNNENKKELDISDSIATTRSVLLNTAQIYLICTNKIDKRESAKLLLKLNRILLSKLLDLELFNLDELVRWSKWRNMQNG